jgi:hypothetical protein
MIGRVLAAWTALDPRVVVEIKVGVALSGALLLAAGIWLRKIGRPNAFRRTRDVLLALLGLAAFCSWWNLGHFHFPDFLQVHEEYHYYLGSKYASELGYTHLYECTVAADIEDGYQEQARWIRDLSNNELLPRTSILQLADRCRPLFTPARWEMFRRDLRWFRAHRDAPSWASLLTDHGYNATPVWTMEGRLLDDFAPASDRQMFALALLDPAILVLMWAVVWSTFGWRAMCVALLWWGTNAPADYSWTGGAYLRTDWLALTTVAICFAKRRQMVSSGVALAYAAWLRVFPALLMAGLVLSTLPRSWRGRTSVFGPETRSFVRGFVIASVFLVGISVTVVGRGWTGGIDAWRGFVTNTEKHVLSPAANLIGLKAVMSYELESRASVLRSYYVDTPWDSWATARRRVFTERRPVFWIVVVGFFLLLARAVKGQEAWVALILGLGLVPFAWEAACYYYAILLVYGLLWETHEWIGVSLCVLSALTWLFHEALTELDDVYVAISVAVLFFVLGVTVSFARHPRRHAADTRQIQ